MALQLFNPAQNENRLRSGLSLTEVYVVFVNTTQRDVNLYWLDYSGHQSFYITLRPGSSTKVDTFQSHPWIFRDRDTGERMYALHNGIYWPKRSVIPNPRNPSQLITCRRQVAIHLPLRTLRESCLWGVLRTGKITWEGIDKLCLPLTLKADLKLVLCALEEHRSNK